MPDLDPPPNVTVVRSAPHTQALEHAAVAISHGGHGTTMKALAAGVPTLVLPLGRDQPDIGARRRALGRRATTEAERQAGGRSPRPWPICSKTLAIARPRGRMAAVIRRDTATDMAVAELGGRCRGLEGSHTMKKAITTLAVASALAAPGAAAAAPPSYVGKTDQGTKVSVWKEKNGNLSLTTSMPSTCVSAQGGTAARAAGELDPPYAFPLGQAWKVTVQGNPTKNYTVPAAPQGQLADREAERELLAADRRADFGRLSHPDLPRRREVQAAPPLTDLLAVSVAQAGTARESRCAPTLRFTRWSALSTVLVSQSSRSAMTS